MTRLHSVYCTSLGAAMITLLKSTSWMSAKLNWFRLPVSHEVTVAVGAEDVLDGVVDVVLGVELVLVCVVVVEWCVVVGGGVDVVEGVAWVVVEGGGGDLDVVLVGAGGAPPPKFHWPYTCPIAVPPGTR